MSARLRFANVALILICLGGIADWLGAQTHRLYVDDDSIRSRQVGSVWQHFALKNNKVVPQMITRDDAHVVFPLDFHVPHKLLFALKAEKGASYEIFRTAGGKRKRIAAEALTKNGRRAISLGAGASELEFTEHGSIAWLDLRMTRSVFLWPLYCAAALALAFVTWRNLRAPYVAELLTLSATIFLSLVVVEAALRHYRHKLPQIILAARAPFGLIPPDARWVDPARYKLRLRGNLNTYAEWRDGDIARLGFIPKNVTRPVLHRFPIRTDAEGFRNAAVREKIEIAALGDSFTDGTNSPLEETWPYRLEQFSGRAVQNYGTAGFGPQQERYVFQDFAAQHKPRWTVLAFFAGNDLHDAEAFDDWERGEHRLGEELTGAKLPANYRRYETLYLWTVIRVATESIRGAARDAPSAPNDSLVASLTSRPRFDRGVFDIPVNGRVLQFAFFPPYLQKLGTPRNEVEASRGWTLTRSTIAALKADCAANGSTLLLMFIPSKEQVYWPLVQRSFSPGELQRAVDYYCRYNNMPLPIEKVTAHELALNEIVRDFCAQNEIPMLDLTDNLRAEVVKGREMFFPDDTHWNAAGNEVAAQELAKFLARQR